MGRKKNDPPPRPAGWCGAGIFRGAPENSGPRVPRSEHYLYQTRLPLYISNVSLSYPRGGTNLSWHPDDWDKAALKRLKIDV